MTRRRYSWLDTARFWITFDLPALIKTHRCGHRMVPMSDGPVCALCGRTWLWGVTVPPEQPRKPPGSGAGVSRPGTERRY